MKNLFTLSLHSAYRILILFVFSTALFSCSKSGSGGGGGSTARQSYVVDLSGSYISSTGKEAQVIRLQKDGKILVLGYGWFVRLEADGVTQDNTFSAPAELLTASSNFKVNSFLVQDDGKILVFGTFVLSNSRKAIVRLNADGSLDNSFNNPVLDINYYRQSIGINEIQLLANGKMIIAGAFSYKVGNTFGNAIARLNADQTIDPDFISPISGDDPFGVTHMQSFQDGTLLLLGYGAIKLSIGGAYNVVKIGADGVYDKTYVMDGSYGPASAPGYTTAVALQGSKVLIGVGFVPTGGNVIRLNENGTVDKTFSAPAIGYEVVNSIAVQPDKSLLIGRQKSFSFPETPDYLNYIDQNGVTDTAFHMTGYIPGGVNSMLNLNETTLLLAGSFSHDNKTYAILKLKKN